MMRFENDRPTVQPAFVILLHNMFSFEQINYSW